MRVHSVSRAPGPYLVLLGLTIVLVFFFRSLILPAVYHTGDLFLPDPGMFVRAGPPIELSDEQVAELTTAYEQGFDHPDPGKGDPCERLRLLPYKKLSTWRKQFSRRGFTMEKIRQMLATGRRQPVTHPKKGTTYTKISDPQGNWIVVDFVDCVIWQVAPHTFK